MPRVFAPSSGASRGDGRGDGGIADSPQKHRDGYPGGEAGCEPEPAAPPPRGWREKNGSGSRPWYGTPA